MVAACFVMPVLVLTGALGSKPRPINREGGIAYFEHQIIWLEYEITEAMEDKGLNCQRAILTEPERKVCREINYKIMAIHQKTIEHNKKIIQRYRAKIDKLKATHVNLQK